MSCGWVRATRLSLPAETIPAGEQIGEVFEQSCWLSVKGPDCLLKSVPLGRKVQPKVSGFNAWVRLHDEG